MFEDESDESSISPSEVCSSQASEEVPVLHKEVDSIFLKLLSHPLKIMNFKFIRCFQ